MPKCQVLSTIYFEVGAKVRDRIKKIIEYMDLSLQELEAQTGITAYKWGNLLTGKQRVNEDHITALDKIAPQFTYWITTGKTLPAAGQTSPDEERARADSARERARG